MDVSEDRTISCVYKNSKPRPYSPTEEDYGIGRGKFPSKNTTIIWLK